MVRTVRVGDRVGAMLVWYIEQDRVWMEFEHELCPFRRAQASPGASDRSLAELVASISPRIHKNSDFDYTLDRSAVAEILEHQGRLLREVRVVPERLDGSVAGIRLFGIRPDSLLGQLGFANGDRVESINGIRTDGSTEAFRKARRANRWTVAVVRSGRPIELTTHTR